MKRNMELCRKILFAIEEQYVSTAIRGLKIDGYTTEEVAYHCKLLHEAGLIKDCKIIYASNHIVSFGVSSLTWKGHDFIDSIREDTIWNKTKDIITQKGLPMLLDVVKEVSQAVITSMVQGAIKGLTQ